MPRETVRSGAGVRGPDVHVGWTKAGEEVQVGVTEPDAVPGETGLFSLSLSRPAINNLIRHLRKARDEAYGADQ